MGSGSAVFFMESGIRDQKFSSFLGSGIKIWGKNMGSVTKNIPRYDPDIMRRSTRNFNIPPPPPWEKPGHLNFSKLDHSNSRPRGPKWCSNALPYCQIFLSYPTKEQLSSAPAICNKDLLKTFFVSQSITNATSDPLNCSISSKHVFYGC